MISTVKNTTGVFSIYIFANAGAINETEEKLGISHMLEHMLFKRTKNMTNKEILSATTKAGGFINAATDKDVTYFFFKTTTEKYDKAIRLMADLLVNPHFVPSDLEPERKVVLEELHKGLDNEDRFVWHMSTLSVLPIDHVYGRKVIGTPDTLMTITVDDLKSYYEKHYNGLIIVMSCENKIKQDAIALAKRLFSKRLQESIVDPPCIPYEVARKVIVFGRESNQNNLMLTFPIFEKYMDVKTVMLLEFLSYALSGAGLYALLTYELREKRGLVYNVSTFNENMKYMSFFKLVLSSTQSDMKMILDIICKIFKRIRKNGLSDKEFKLFKDGFKNAMGISLASEDFQTILIGMQIYNSNTKDDIDIDAIKQVIHGITNRDVKDIANKVFDFSHMGIVCAGNFQNAQQYSDELLHHIEGKFV